MTDKTIADVLEFAPRAEELATRLVAAGPKAAHVSASETHEIADFVHMAIAVLSKLRAPVADEREPLPCPFCGGRAFATYKTDEDDIRWHSVHCRTECRGYGKHGSEKDAIAAWNTRTTLLRKYPNDEEIIDLAVEPLGIDCDRMPHGVVVFARNLLSRYAAPQASTVDGLPVWWERFMNELTLRSEDEVRNDLAGILEICALDAIASAAPQASEAKNYPGDDVAERLDNMADDQPPGSQVQSDLYAAATIWRKHIVHRAAPQASEAVRDALHELVEVLQKRHYGRMPDEVQKAFDTARAALSAQSGAQKTGGSDAN